MPLSDPAVVLPESESIARSKRALATCVVVDSRQRDFSRDPTASAYRVQLPRIYHNVTAARLIEAEIPSTAYLFAAALGNTSLTAVVGGTSAAITVPDGTYTAGALATALEAALAAAFPAYAFTVTVSNTTLIMSIACSPSATIAVDTTAALASPKMTDWGLAYYCGFPRGAVTQGTGAVSGTAAVNVNTTTYFLLSLGAALDRTYAPGMYGQGGYLACFAKIPLNCDHGDIMYFDKQFFANRLEPPIKRLEYLDVAVLAPDGSAAVLNGAEHSFTVELTCTDVV